MGNSFKELSKEKKILMVAQYIIQNKATIETVASYFDISESSVKKYINNPENLQSIDENIYKAVKDTQEILINHGNYVGGKNGKREPSISDFEAMEIAETMIEDKLSLTEASKIFHIPTSTIYERIRGIEDDVIQNKLNELFVENSERFGRK